MPRCQAVRESPTGLLPLSIQLPLSPTDCAHSFSITRLKRAETLPGVLCRNNKVTEEDLKLRCLADKLAEAQKALQVRAPACGVQFGECNECQSGMPCRSRTCAMSASRSMDFWDVCTAGRAVRTSAS